MKKIAKKALYNKRLLYKLFGFSMFILFLIFQPFDLLSNINTGIKRNVIITLIFILEKLFWVDFLCFKFASCKMFCYNIFN